MKSSLSHSPRRHATYLTTVGAILTIAGLPLILAALNTPAHAQTYTVLYNFGSHTGDPADPRYSGIIAQGRDGNLYSTADDHSSDGLGSVFKITPAGVLTVLHHFSGSDGQGSVSGLTLGADGNFYGTTDAGGVYSRGTIFRITAEGALTTLHSFKGGAEGSNPEAPPIEGIDANFYGTTAGGSTTSDYGSVYKITPSGTFTTLHTFANIDGASPYAPLLQGTDGYFYGTTFSGGTAGVGTIFRISSAGAFKTLLNFDGGSFSNGGHPYGPLIQGSDGNFYGSAATGGFEDAGVAFQVTPSGVLSVLRSFVGAGDGANPVGGVVQATDGNIYGTNTSYGDDGEGVIFLTSPSGAFAVLYAFDCYSGARPQVTLLQHTNGKLYGDAGGVCFGGVFSQGVFYSLDMALGPFVTFLPAARQVGHTVEFLGQGFIGTSAVSFNGTPAPFTVVSDTYLTATVPEGATSGFVTVTTPGGTLKSNKKFLVKPQIISFSPASGPVGTSVVITGVSLRQTWKVVFNGYEAAPFTVNSDTQITVTVPAGATSGNIGIKTTGAPAYSATPFTVTP